MILSDCFEVTVILEIKSPIAGCAFSLFCATALFMSRSDFERVVIARRLLPHPWAAIKWVLYRLGECLTTCKLLGIARCANAQWVVITGHN